MPRRRDKEATQSEILAAASQLFADKGYADTSLTDIAKLAGVTKSLIHHHFGTKEQLWEVVARSLFEGYRTLQTEQIRDQPDTLETFIESMRGYFAFLQDNPLLRRMQSWMALEDVPSSTRHVQLMVEGVAKLKRAQDNGELRDDIPPTYILMSFLFLAQHWFQAKESLFHGLPEEHQRQDADGLFLESILSILVDGIRPR